MIVKLEDRKVLIALANEYMDKYSINEFEALKMAENDVEKQREKIDFLNKDGISLGDKNMKEEQLKFFGNIIEFPKNKIFRNKEILDKYYVAIKLLKYMVDEGHDFNITVTKDAASKIFINEDLDKTRAEIVILTTSMEFEENIKNKRKTYFLI